MSDWVGHAQRELEREGYRLSGPRSAVVETLADLGCSVTAKEIADSLHHRGEDVGVASIYRTLELLDKLRLTRRVDAAEGVARYEPIGPKGEHHHHIVCESCGEGLGVRGLRPRARHRAARRARGLRDRRARRDPAGRVPRLPGQLGAGAGPQSRVAVHAPAGHAAYERRRIRGERAGVGLPRASLRAERVRV